MDKKFLIASVFLMAGGKGDRMKCWNGVTAVNGITH